VSKPKQKKSHPWNQAQLEGRLIREKLERERCERMGIVPVNIKIDEVVK